MNANDSINNWNIFSNGTPVEQNTGQMINHPPNELKSTLNTLKLIAQNESNHDYRPTPSSDRINSLPKGLQPKMEKEQRQQYDCLVSDEALDLHHNNDHGEFDDDDDSIVDDDESMPSPDAMYANEYNSPNNDSNNSQINERNGIDNHEDPHERYDGSSSKDGSTESQLVSNHATIGPLAQLQNALERHSGMLGMNLTNFGTPNGGSHVLFGGSINSQNSINSLATPGIYNPDNDITGELYRCHLCSYTGPSKFHFNAHMNTHFDHKCPFCDYTSRTEGRLKRHIRDFHSEVPPESWAGTRLLKTHTNTGDGSNSSDTKGTNNNGNSGKNRKYKCKQCEFIATCKQEFWDHSIVHMKPEKMLRCPECKFATEYKHHLEYHLRNHFGSKPFKCAKCNYSCVNKSMLNSHMKSHSNIYQFRCAECNYATKYCHSLKLHLRKYSHKPATVLNLDGTPNPYPVIDVYGTRRGPRPKKSKNQSNHTPNSSIEEQSSPQSLITTPISPISIGNSPAIPQMMPTNMPLGLPFLYPPTSALLHRELMGHHQLQQIPPQVPSQVPPFSLPLYDPIHTIPKSSQSTAYKKGSPTSSHGQSNRMKCNFCDFVTESRENFGKHLLVHVASENQDICKIYGIPNSADAAQQKAIINELALQSPFPDSRRLLDHFTTNASLMNSFFNMQTSQESDTKRFPWPIPKDVPLPMMDMDVQRMTQTDTRPVSAPTDSVIKSSISPLPRSRSSPNDVFSINFESNDQSNEQSKVKEIQMHSDTIPLDLSSNKSASPIIEIKPQPIFSPEIVTALHDQEEHEHDLQQQQQQLQQQQQQQQLQQQQQQQLQQQQEQHQQSRAQKRKGKACKLNINRLYMQIHSGNNIDEDNDKTNTSESSDEDAAYMDAITSQEQQIISEMFIQNINQTFNDYIDACVNFKGNLSKETAANWIKECKEKTINIIKSNDGSNTMAEECPSSSLTLQSNDESKLDPISMNVLNSRLNRIEKIIDNAINCRNISS